MSLYVLSAKAPSKPAPSPTTRDNVSLKVKRGMCSSLVAHLPKQIKCFIRGEFSCQPKWWLINFSGIVQKRSDISVVVLLINLSREMSCSCAKFSVVFRRCFQYMLSGIQMLRAYLVFNFKWDNTSYTWDLRSAKLLNVNSIYFIHKNIVFNFQKNIPTRKIIFFFNMN